MRLRRIEMSDQLPPNAQASPAQVLPGETNDPPNPKSEGVVAVLVRYGKKQGLGTRGTRYQH